MEEIPDDVFAPSVSEMDGVQPGPRRQQHFGVSTHYWMAKKNTVRGQFNVKFILQSTFFIIYGTTNIIYTHMYVYIYL